MRFLRSTGVALAFLPTLAVAQKPAPSKPASAATSRDILPFKASETTLPNGLKVIVVPTGFPNLVSVQVSVQTGSRNEFEPGKSGFAHFFEHMMFRGTKKYAPEKYNAVMTKAGARSNATTNDDRTLYYATFAKEDLEQILEMMADQFQNLDYAEPEFKTEARAVLGEYNKNVANPAFKLYETTRKTAFSKHTYGHTTMGFIEDIEDMPNQYQYSKVFFDRWYRPEYSTLVIGGDVSPEQVLPLVQKYWGPWTRGTYKATVPQEPAPSGPKYAHVPWPTPTPAYVSVSFRNAPFSETNKDNAALDMVANIWFGPTSDVYRKLVIEEQKVDNFGAGNSSNIDPELFSITARLKDPKDAAYVRDEILRVVDRARAELVPAWKLDDSKSAFRYGFVRTLDNTNSITTVIANMTHHRRSYGTLNAAYRLYDALSPADLKAASTRWFTDANLIVTTLSNGPLAAEVATQPKLGTLAKASYGAGSASDAQRQALQAKIKQMIDADMKAAEPLVAGNRLPTLDVTTQKSALPQLQFKLLFDAGSAYDPKGKEGLAALSAAMIAGGGSRALTIQEIRQALYPMAASFGSSVDKEMATFTGSVHKDNWHEFLHIALGQLAKPGFREEDFTRLKTRQLVALTSDLRANNEEELGKERLQENVFAGTPYGHPALGTVEGIQAITLDDVKQFVRTHYTRANLKVGLSGDVPEHFQPVLAATLAELPEGTKPAHAKVAGAKPSGINVEIIRKDTRSTAISFGLPIAVTRSHPDFAALSVARVWLGEHRMSGGRLFQRIREIRGFNYGNYAYIEAFPGGMYGFFPSPNIARQAQLFEVWIRPTVPENAHMALRIATHEVEQLIRNGLSEEDFANSRDYLMKNVYVMTATQDQQLGYALDAKWYGTPEFTSYMRDRLSKLTRDEVNAAIRRHLSATDLSVVIITQDAEGLKSALVSDAPSTVKYDAPKPQAILDEDKVIGARKLGIKAENVRITPVEEVFRR